MIPMKKLLMTTIAILSLTGYAEAGTRMLHNGSVMDLSVERGDVVIRYVEPRLGMAEYGARPGSLLVSGGWHEDTLDATAYIFTRHCGVIPYQVSGGYSRGNLVLDGPAPIIDNRCRVVRYDWNNNSHLVFNNIDGEDSQ
jgi:hypothetical protein